MGRETSSSYKAMHAPGDSTRRGGSRWRRYTKSTPHRATFLTPSRTRPKLLGLLSKAFQPRCARRHGGRLAGVHCGATALAEAVGDKAIAIDKLARPIPRSAAGHGGSGRSDACLRFGLIVQRALLPRPGHSPARERPRPFLVTSCTDRGGWLTAGGGGQDRRALWLLTPAVCQPRDRLVLGLQQCQAGLRRGMRALGQSCYFYNADLLPAKIPPRSRDSWEECTRARARTRAAQQPAAARRSLQQQPWAIESPAAC